MSAVLEENGKAKTVTLANLRNPAAPETHMPAVRMGFGDLQGYELTVRAAKAIAASSLVPEQFQNNLPNCIIALEMANRIGASPLMVCQNLYVVYGRPGWSAKFLIASFNQCGRYTSIRYEWQGKQGTDEWGCRAWATEKSTGEKIIGPLITIKLAKDEKWYDKSGSKWKTIPELMLTYRAAAWMINTHAPEISMGLNTADELGDVFDASAGNDGSFSVTQDELRGKVDKDTGEIKPDDAPPPKQDGAPTPVGYEMLLSLIVNCADTDELDQFATRIGEVSDLDQQNKLAVAYQLRRAELDSKPAKKGK